MARGSSRLVDRGILIVEALVGVLVVGAIIGRTYGFSSTLVFILCGAAAAFTGYVLVKMLSALSDDTLEITGRVDDEERAALEHEKILLLQGIKELEADAGVGKVDSADYQHLRETAETRALQIIHKLKESDQRWRSEAERYVATKLGRAVGPARTDGVAPVVAIEDTERYRQETAGERRARRAYSKLFDDRPVEMRAASVGRIACSGCDTENEEDARYCIGCGRPKKDGRPEAALSAEGTA
jgi:low affinity Fe/Cu permease